MKLKVTIMCLWQIHYLTLLLVIKNAHLNTLADAIMAVNRSRVIGM